MNGCKYIILLMIGFSWPSLSCASIGEAIINDCATNGGYEVTSYNSNIINTPEIYIFGVYEASSNHTVPGEADVYVERKNVPLVIVLSSYEPVVWTLHSDQGVNITQIIVNGYYDQVIVGADNIPIVNRSGVGNYVTATAYEWPSTRADELKHGVEEIIGTPLYSFSGCYRAASFSIKDSEIGNCVDMDNDGVPDPWDQCADTPTDSYTDRNGCNPQNLYTESQVNNIINNILLWGDTDGDGKIGMVEAINALRTTSGAINSHPEQ